ncbi:IS200/IS605 family transposase [Roseimaritima sediminicola]|uniref:IS200/IS605 family transposase n=1 Tax=Roseimaritima sediminicola TaxID=2662066 RepID=UPI0012983291|nr:IS200/IS605 family transposase [Roseimaritima sediminicola]
MSTHHGILLHVVFSTKHRRQWLSPKWQKDMYAYMGGTLKQHKAVLLNAGGIEDHVHLFVRIHPSFAISKTIQMVKAGSSRWINDLSVFRGKFQWQRGYGAFSVSQSKADAVRLYVDNQQAHHRGQTFKEEYLAILNKHQVPFDPKYVFEEEIVA